MRKTAEKLLLSKLKSHLLTEEKARRAAEKAMKQQKTADARAEKQQGRKRKRGEQGAAPASTSAAAKKEKQPSSTANVPAAPASRNNNGASTSHLGLAALAAQQRSEAENLDAAAELLEDNVAVEAAGRGPQDAEDAHEPLDSVHASDYESEESAGEIDLDAMVGEGGALIICLEHSHICSY